MIPLLQKIWKQIVKKLKYYNTFIYLFVILFLKYLKYYVMWYAVPIPTDLMSKLKYILPIYPSYQKCTKSTDNQIW